MRMCDCVTTTCSYVANSIIVVWAWTHAPTKTCFGVLPASSPSIYGSVRLPHFTTIYESLRAFQREKVLPLNFVVAVHLFVLPSFQFLATGLQLICTTFVSFLQFLWVFMLCVISIFACVFRLAFLWHLY